MIADRFEIRSELARGPKKATYRAFDHELGVDVALNEVAIADADGWDRAAFERGAAALQALDHAAIPRYLDARVVDDGEGLRVFVAQLFADGPTLEELRNDGKQWTDEEALADALGIVEALNYLHELDPPVVHGNVAPGHFVRCADGHVAVVDFSFATDSSSGHTDDLQALGDTIGALFASTGALSAVIERLKTDADGGGYESVSDVLRDLRGLTESTQKSAPVTAPLAAPPLASTAPLAAPKPVPALNETAPLAAPKPLNFATALVAPVLPSPPASAAPTVSDEVLYYRRTKDFPRWTTVEPQEHGEFLIEADLRDVEERRLELEIIDTLNRLELRAWINRKKRSEARKKRLIGVVVAGSIASVAAFVFYAPILPLIVVASLAGLAMFVVKSDGDEERPHVELTIAPDEISLNRDGEFRLRSEPRVARWTLARHTELFLTTDREVPVLLLSHEMRMQGDWLHRYLEARCQEIGSRRHFQPGAKPEQPAVAAPAPVLPDPPTEEVHVIKANEVDTAEVSPLSLPVGVSPDVLNRVRDAETEEFDMVKRPTEDDTQQVGMMKRPVEDDTQQVEMLKRPTEDDTQQVEMLKRPTEDDTQQVEMLKRPVEDVDTQQVELSQLDEPKSEVDDQATQEVSLGALAGLADDR